MASGSWIVQVRAVLVQRAVFVKHDKVFRLCAQGNVQLHAGHGGGACPIDHELHFFDLLLLQFQGVQQGCAADDGGAVLVVVHHGYLQGFPQFLFNVEAFGGLDVFQVDAAKCRLQCFYDLYKFLGVFFSYFDVEHINIGEDLEEYALTFHDGFAGLGSDVAQAEHSRTVTDHSHQVSLGRVLVNVIYVNSYFLAWFGHPWRVGQGKVPLGLGFFGGNDFNLAGPAFGMILKGLFTTQFFLHICV
jgi:hypothetical protein